MAKIQRSPSAQAAFNEIRHQAALKAWDKRGRKKDRDAAAAAGIAQAAAGAVSAHKGGIGLSAAGARPAVDDRAGGVKVTGPYGARGDWNASPHADLERRMRETPQKTAKKLGGGVSESYVVKLEDGTKGNFKPASGELEGVRDGIEHGQMVERELGAWEVAKLVGMDDMVAPVADRECDVPGGGFDPRGRPYKAGVKRGSFAFWQEGDVAATVSRATAYDGDDGAQRSALFDYIIGNQDRHGQNWVVAPDKTIKLIDHGYAFGEQKVRGASHFVDRVIRSQRMSRMSPAKFAENYTKNKSKILSKLKSLGLPDAAIERVGRRIDRASVATKWSDFLNDKE